MPVSPEGPNLKGKEFVNFPDNYNGFVIEPDADLKLGKEPGAVTTLTLFNQDKTIPVLYKVKCTSNKRIAILDCAGVLEPGKEAQIQIKRKKYESGEEDQLIVCYCLLGETGGDNAIQEWRRVQEQQISTKNFIVKIVLV